MSKDIKNIRDKIDSIDSEILKLLNERAQEAVNISKEKQKSKNLTISIIPKENLR